MYKIVSLFLLCVIMILTFSACTISQGEESSGGWVVETVTTVVNSNSSDKTSSTQDTPQKNNVSSKNVPASSNISVESESTENVFDSNYCTQQMLEKSIMYKGDTTRLASKIKAALKDKNSITKMAFLGDSITEGAVVGVGNNHYANVFANFWRKNIGNNVNVNIKGYGATTSHLGVHIAEDVILKDKPDIIFIEYVNDSDGVQYMLDSIDSLLRKCLSLDNKPAVILLEMSYHGTTNAQNTHYKPAKAYGVPMISWQNALRLPMINGDIKWSDVSPDEVHPNKTGHRMLSEMMWYFTELVLPTASNAKEPAAFNTPAVTEDVYKECKILNRTNFTPTNIGNFTESVDFGPLKNGWATTSGGTITFKVSAKSIGIAYLASHQNDNGKAEIYLDGNLFTTVNGKQSGYSCIRTIHIRAYKTVEEHTVTIKISEGNSNNFQILGLFAS